MPSPARKQRSWLSALPATGSPAAAASSRTSRLRELGEREAKPRQRPGAQAGEHVGLVLGRVRGRGQQRALAVVREPRVVAGGERIAAETLGERQHRVDPQLAVADHARVRRLPCPVAVDEGADHSGAEVALEVERQVRDPEPVRQPPGAEHGGRRAAALRLVGAPVGPQLQRHRDHLRPAIALAQGRDRRVDSAAERDQHPLAGVAPVSERLTGAGEPGERAVQRVGGELDRVAPLRAEPAELGGDLLRSERRHLEHGRALGERSGRGRGGAGGGAALGVGARPLDPPARRDQRDSDQVAARGPAGRPVVAADERLAATPGELQVVPQ